MIKYIYFIFVSNLIFSEAQNEHQSERFRPCAGQGFFGINELCLRNYFMLHSNCTAPTDEFPQPFYHSYQELQFPTFNTVAIRNGSYVTLNGNVEDFFVDEDSNYAVLTMNFQNLFIDTPDTQYRLNRKGDIPLYYSTWTQVNYPKVTLTTVFYNSSNLSLADSTHSAYLHQHPIVISGEKMKVIDDILANLDSGANEAFMSESTYFANMYIQGYICDFGVPYQ